MKIGDRVQRSPGYSRGVVRRVVDTPTGAMCCVFFGHREWDVAKYMWLSVDDLRCCNHEVWGRQLMTRLYGTRYPVCHIDATGHDIANIRVAMRVNMRADRSTYVHHMERVRKTRHRHPIGQHGMFNGIARYITVDGELERAEPKPRPCTIISHDTRCSWSGFTESWYTVQFRDGSTRSYVIGSQYQPR